MLYVYAPLPIVKILQITKKPPFPLNDGESWAVRNLARSLKLYGCDIDLLSIASDIEEVERWTHEVTDIYESIDIIRHDTQPRRLGALINLFSSKSYHQTRYEDVKKSLDINLFDGPYDVILAETLYTMPIALSLSQNLGTPIVLRAHNQEYLIWEEYSDHSPGLKKWYFHNQSRRIHKYELDMIRKSSGVLFVSGQDQNLIKGLSPMSSQVVPIALELPEFKPSYVISEPIILGFLGSLDWKPNIQGLQRFLNEIWPHLKSSSRDMRLMIAGKNPDRALLSIDDDDISFIGQVEDSAGFLSQLHAMITPLWSGSGTRVKILEAMSLGVPIITTSKGCEGLDVKDGEHLFIADTTEDWIRALEATYNHDVVHLLRAKARDYIFDRHDLQSTGELAMNFLRSVV